MLMLSLPISRMLPLLILSNKKSSPRSWEKYWSLRA